MSEIYEGSIISTYQTSTPMLTGHLNSTYTPTIGNGRVYVRSSSTQQYGVLKIQNTSFQSTLKKNGSSLPSNVSWKQLSFTNVKLSLVEEKGTIPTGTKWDVVLSTTLPNTNNPWANDTNTGFKNTNVSQFGITATVTTEKSKQLFTFDLTTLFNLLRQQTNILPTTTSWYLIIRASGEISGSGDLYFYSRNQSDADETWRTPRLNFIANYSSYSSPFYLYEDDKWKTLTPYIYDGKWIQLDAKMF